MEDRIVKGRLRARYTPSWEGPIEGYAVSVCKAQAWRVAPAMDFSDLYQDSWLLFDKLRDAYPTVIEAKHFMALFKTSLFRYITTLASQRTRRHEVLTSTLAGAGSTDITDIARAPDEIEDTEVNLMLDDAPPFVKRICEQYGDRATVPQRFKRRGRIRETTRVFLCRLAKVDPYSCNILQEIRQWAQNGLEVKSPTNLQNAPVRV